MYRESYADGIIDTLVVASSLWIGQHREDRTLGRRIVHSIISEGGSATMTRDSGTTGTATASALDGVRVLDLAGEEGVYCTKLLADLGADVIRVESPDGDGIRSLGPFVDHQIGPERGIPHLYLNTSKRSVTLNLETTDGQELFRKLIATADIVVETYRPGYLKTLGLGYDDLRQIKQDIILTSITGFGQTGPHAQWESSDLIAGSMSGVVVLAGYPERPPHRPPPGQAFYCGGIQATTGTLLALTARDVHGGGQWVDVSLQESMLNAQENAMMYWDMHRSVRRRRGAAPGFPVYECADGYILGSFGFLRGGALVRLVQWMAEKEQAGDLVSSGTLAELEAAAESPPEDLANPEELERAAALLERVMDHARKFFKSNSKQYLYTEGQRRSIMIGAANDPGDIIDSEQLAFRQWFVDLPHPELGRSIKFPGVPFRLTDSPSRLRHRAPLLGEHNTNVYCDELGLAADELTRLREIGAI